MKEDAEKNAGELVLLSMPHGDLRPRQSAVVLLFIALFLVPANGQQRLTSHLIRPVPTDTDAVIIEGAATEVALPEEKSTTLAIALSAVAPGAGQLYSGRYLSIPVIWGFGYYFWTQYDKQNRRYHDYDNQFTASVLADTVNHAGNADFKRIRDIYRDDRDRFAIYLGMTYLLNIVDAYVGAALYGFDVSPNLNPSGEGELRLRYTIRRP